MTGTNSFYTNVEDLISEQETLKSKYRTLRSLLDDILKSITKDQEIQFPDLFSRLVYVCEKLKIPQDLQRRIHLVRKNAHLNLLNSAQTSDSEYLRDVAALIQFYAQVSNSQIPDKLLYLLNYKETAEENESDELKFTNHHSLLRCYVKSVRDEIIQVQVSDLSENIWSIYWEENSVFKDSFRFIHPGDILHLIDCRIENHTICPEWIILEPDYLIDISSLAECIKAYGAHPYYYFIQRLQSKSSSTPILIGNLANHFLDVFVNNTEGESIDFHQVTQEVFKMYLFDISVNESFDDVTKKRMFFADLKSQFEHIRYVVEHIFPKEKIITKDAVLEPSFMCSQLGVQGRLDFLSISKHHTSVVELKSGKAPFPESRIDLVAENHKSQLFLYQMVIQWVLNIPFKDIHSYLFYSKYSDSSANLRMVKPYMDAIKRIFHIRNQIIAIEKNTVRDEKYFEKIIQNLIPQNLIYPNAIDNKLVLNYIIPQLEDFLFYFKNATPLEKTYFFSFYHFITQEQYISKAGLSHQEQSPGHAALWLCDDQEKFEKGNILLNLRLIENLSHQNPPILKLSIPENDGIFLPNFRRGDIVLLYKKNNPNDSVKNQQIFRGTILDIRSEEITLKLRNSQRNSDILPKNSLYAIEQDYMDASFSSMYRGLYSFLTAEKERKRLLLNQRSLRINKEVQLLRPLEDLFIRNIVLKSKQAEDYFLLLGPPGTGKTSVALKAMVHEYYSDNQINILLLAYTNRAVDEICSAINDLPNIEFIRIGSEYSTDPKYHKRLLKNVIQHETKRDAIKNILLKNRIFVGTIASISGKLELLRIKQFQVAIIDEASQILEPQLLGILTARHDEHTNAIQKFILVGDQKQLPAIVVQNPSSSQVVQNELIKIGLYDRRNSLFERLYRIHEKDENSMHSALLNKQGRMHPELAEFVNKSFYNQELSIVPTPHQVAPLEWDKWDKNDIIQNIIAQNRSAFFCSKKSKSDLSFKVNSYEVEMVIEIIKAYLILFSQNNIAFDPHKSIGIITPYRSQIAKIKKELQALQITELLEITVDTVERYQGSQRDIIIYSMCINELNQLEMLSSIYTENEILIDRKFNVALTRAKKQMFVIGNPYYLSQNSIYNSYIHYHQEKDTYFGMDIFKI